MKQGAFIPQPEVRARLRAVVGDFTCREWQDWRWQVRHSVRSLAALERLLPILPAERARWRALLRRYPCRITPYYMSLIRWDDVTDPLRRQCVPDLRERETLAAVAEDPLGECRHLVVPGLMCRYQDRALVLVTGECALVCRHCTRKNFFAYGRPAYNAVRPPAALRAAMWAGSTAGRPTPTRAFLRRIVDAVAHLSDVREVIVSGGDPLLLDEDLLDWFLGALRAIPHVQVLRIGTRVPVVLPMRGTRALCACLERHRPLWINTQFNHPRELTPAATQACDRLLRAGLPVSNQTVLLRGVNDDFETLKALCNALQRIMVRPYYLFQCDPVRGVGHFSTPLPFGVRLAEQLRAALGGLSVPQFVVDLPGGGGKVPLQSSHIVSMTSRKAVLRGFRGERYECKSVWE
ncbi:MAG: lysine 2,3-aminomutase [Verrucomicrobia bacterium]|nr:lysine 2,3-aminomutase [Verrucomicrobiota bacterium]